MYSHPHRPRPGRRRHQLTWCNLSILSVFIIITTFATPTWARDIRLSYEDYDSPLFRRLARRGEIVIDRRNPPPRPHIQQRQEGGDPFASTAGPLSTPTSEDTTTDAASSTETDTTATLQTTDAVTPTLTITQSSSASAMENATASIGTASPTAGVSSPQPSAFDTSLGSNFTSEACPRFFSDFLQNATFKECRPTSLLLLNSNSFFRTSRSPVLLSQTLDTSCRASLAQCRSIMLSLASQLIQDSNCGQDYRNENPLVTQAYAGLIAYEPLYRATCLKNDATGNYCFADAITNASNPSDAYPYYTALGTHLPGSSRPTCDNCLQETMAIFVPFAANKTQPLSKTYIGTAEQINLGCGPGFVNATVPVAVQNAATRQGAVTDTSALTAFVVGLVVAVTAF